MHRPLIVLAALAAALVLAGSASQPACTCAWRARRRPSTAPPSPSLEGGANALTALDAASLAGELYYHVTQTSFGPYVDQVGRYPGGGSTGWVFKVNGVSPPVGADQVALHDGDTVLWYFATFGPTGGPKTLALRRGARRNCYRVVAQDDAGKATAAAGAVLHVDGRSVRTRAGAGCVGRHAGLVKATLAGAVRSNALR